MIMTTLTQLKRQVRWPYQRLCRFLGCRMELPAVEAPPGAWPASLFPAGSQEGGALNLAELHGDLSCLNHGRQRSRESVRCIGSTKTRSPVAICRR